MYVYTESFFNTLQSDKMETFQRFPSDKLCFTKNTLIFFRPLGPFKPNVSESGKRQIQEKSRRMKYLFRPLLPDVH